MNKKAQWQALLNPVTIFLFIVIIIFFASGGSSAISNITKAITSLPPIAWIFIGIMILLFLFRGRRRKR